VRSAGTVETRPQALELFAPSLGAEDQALEPDDRRDVYRADDRAGRRLRGGANTRRLQLVSAAKAKTDRRDARTLARLLASGFLEEVWSPDEETRRAGSSTAGSGCCAPARRARTRSTRLWRVTSAPPRRPGISSAAEAVAGSTV
jgi:hypothetical protein